MHDKNYLFYPYTDKSYSFVKGLIASNINFDVISPIGYGLNGKDLSYVTNRMKLKKTIKDIHNIDFSQYNSILLSNNINELMLDELEVIATSAGEHKIEIVNLSGEFNLDTLDFRIQNEVDDIESEIKEMMNRIEEFGLAYYKSQKPIILVGGILESIDDFSISLGLKLEFEKQGYKTQLITDEKDAIFFNCIKYPASFMSNKVSAEIQIWTLNRFIQAIETLKNPDIIIVHIPEGMIHYNNYFDNAFGSYAFIIGQSLQADYFILNLVNSIVDDRYLKQLDEYFKVILGKEIDLFNLTNSYYEEPIDRVEKLDHPLYLDETEINQIVNFYKGKYNLKNLNNPEEIQRTINDIIQKF